MARETVCTMLWKYLSSPRTLLITNHSLCNLLIKMQTFPPKKIFELIERKSLVIDFPGAVFTPQAANYAKSSLCLLKTSLCKYFLSSYWWHLRKQ